MSRKIEHVYSRLWLKWQTWTQMYNSYSTRNWCIFFTNNRIRFRNVWQFIIIEHEPKPKYFLTWFRLVLPLAARRILNTRGLGHFVLSSVAKLQEDEVGKIFRFSSEWVVVRFSKSRYFYIYKNIIYNFAWRYSINTNKTNRTIINKHSNKEINNHSIAQKIISIRS